MTKAQAIAFRNKLNAIIDDMDDETAQDNTELFPMWVSGKSYIVNDRVQYGDLLYKCVQAHTSQEDWTPDQTPALWVLISIEEWPEWRQPQGAHNAYELGAKVSHNGKHWISTIPANVYEPGVAGWDEVTE